MASRDSLQRSEAGVTSGKVALDPPSSSSPRKKQLQRHLQREDGTAWRVRNESDLDRTPIKPRKRSRSLSDDSELVDELRDDSDEADAQEPPHKSFHTSPISSESSLLPIAAQLQTVWPSLSLGDLLALASSLTANHALLELAARQSLAYRSRGADSSTLSILARILFRRPDHGSFNFGSAPGVSLVDQASNERRAILLAAHALDLIPSDPAIFSKPRLATPIRSIVTHHRVCYQCGGVLQIRKRDLHEVWVLHPSSIERGTAVRLDCATKRCRAKHWPDVVEIKQDGVRVYVHTSDTLYLKLGRRFYATRAFAAAYVALLETNHVSSSSYAELYTRLYCSASALDPSTSSSTPPLIRGAHIWRAFVLETTLELAADASPSRPFVTLAESSTEEIVSMALQAFLSEKTIPAAMDHTCPDCSRHKRRWKAGAKADQGQFAERASGRRDGHLVEDTRIDESKVVKMAVMDGIRIGHAKCAYPPCKADPLNHTTQRFCIDHEHYHSLCGVYGCDQPRKPIDLDDEDAVETEACERDDHQALWEQRVKRKGRMNAMGYSRVVRELSQREKKKAGIRKEVEEEWSDEEDVAEGSVEGDHEDEGPKGGRKPPQTMWSFGTMAGIQLLLFACGCPIGWEKFYTAESPEEVLDFLSDISTASSGQLPSFIAYDRACQLLATIEQDESLHHWLTDVKLLCDAFHFAGSSKYDVLCRTFCDPAPLDGSAPDLVVPMVEEKRKRRRGDEEEAAPKRVYRRAFNTEAAEQINSWLHGFSFILRQLRADNFDFLLHVLLRRRFKLRSEVLTKRHKGVRVG